MSAEDSRYVCSETLDRVRRLENLLTTLVDQTERWTSEISTLRKEIDKLKNHQNKLRNQLTSEISTLRKEIDKLKNHQNMFSLNSTVLQLFYVYMNMYRGSSMELHRIDSHYLIVVDSDDTVLLTIITDMKSEEIEKLLLSLSEILEKTLDKKVVHKIFVLNQPMI